MAKVAFVLADDFEDTEFRVPYDRLKSAGHEITIVGMRKGAEVHGKRGKEKIQVDATPDEVRPESFQALVIPGGYSPDKLRMDPELVRFVREIALRNTPIGAICHAASLLIEARIVNGKRLTSWPSIRTDLENAGARWEDRAVVEDGWLITSRNPGDAEAFATAIQNRLRVAAHA
jgi:protease I